MLGFRNDVSGRRADLSKMCWSCALKQQRAWMRSYRVHVGSTSGKLPLKTPPIRRTALSAKTLNIRSYRSNSPSLRQLDATSFSDPPAFNPAIESLDRLDEEDKPKAGGIRDQLRKWDEEHGHDKTLEVGQNDDVNEFGEATNNFTRLGDVDNFRRPEEASENDRDELGQVIQASPDEIEDFDPQHRFLRKGDLVELEFPRSERESVIAVFVRRVGESPPQSQFYTVHGKWIHVTERQIQYAIPNFFAPETIDPIIPYLPEAEVNDELLDRAQMFDLSVPRHVSAPLVTQMLDFQKESEAIYRQHASTLDGAHQALAHPTDLKFGSLDLIATRLFGKNKNERFSPAKLYAVRKALVRGGFGFGLDRRSHRLTGFIQIRSKDQVATVEKVRNWLRAWQDDLARSAGSNQGHHAFSDESRYVVDFIQKARSLVQTSRETRDATQLGRVSPSKKRFDIYKEELVQYHHTVEFTDEDRELIKFLEGWSCSNVFLGLPRVEALPPLILQATGMYEEHALGVETGFLFLQEIGVLTPHENRVRFDSHLLLPSSQHSKPLEQLMTKIMKLGEDPKLTDSMADLRKDWGDLTVFCIDSEGAHEIDDGISLESAGEDEYWVHVHIANPTAFFDHESPLAKMARHMTETIYMPERPFLMLPRWATKKYFSLNSNRPCLTFSAKMNMGGQTLEHKITPGFIRNVKFITPAEASRVIGVDKDTRPDIVLTVGGTPPRSQSKKTAKSLTESEVQSLKVLQKLAEARQSKRRLAGGLFLDSHRPEINIWTQKRGPGLGWEHPSRARSRVVEGETLIEYRTKELISWFSTGEGVSDILVREMMLLACEVGAEWCADRRMPVIYRGTLPSLDGSSPERYYQEVLAPATEKNGGEAPMHLAIEYLRSTGSTVLSARPLHHRVLGLPFYSKVTSPLRRYGDMILHWQVEAALREEAKSGQSLKDSRAPLTFLPYSHGALEQTAKALQPREAMIRRATRYGEDFWMSQLFFRAFHYGECELPSTFSAYMYSNPSTQMLDIPVLLKEYSAGVAMIRPDTLELGEAKAGDWWEVKIDSVDVFLRKILVRPTRLISRWET